MLQLLSLTKWFFNQISVIHDNISSQVVDKRRDGFGQHMNTSITHDNICEVIHKKCHPKSYHSNIKYHMTLYILFIVVLHWSRKNPSLTTLLSHMSPPFCILGFLALGSLQVLHCGHFQLHKQSLTLDRAGVDKKLYRVE